MSAMRFDGTPVSTERHGKRCALKYHRLTKDDPMTQIAETPFPSEVPAGMSGGRYITADSARTLAAALTESADLLDATEAV
jgi:hypothetical protein